jgi:hypothetical protein
MCGCDSQQPKLRRGVCFDDTKAGRADTGRSFRDGQDGGAGAVRRRSNDEVRRIAGTEGGWLLHGRDGNSPLGGAGYARGQVQFRGLLEDAPETYYVTDYYGSYPIVLARLSQLDRDALRDLLSVSWRLTLAKTRNRRRTRRPGERITMPSGGAPRRVKAG